MNVYGGFCGSPLLRMEIGFAGAVVVWAVVLSTGVAAVQRGIRNGLSHLLRRPRDSDWSYTTESIDAIVEDANHYTYPPDDYYKRIQDKIPKSMPFPCDDNAPERIKWRSDRRPKSVHKLRPGDIDVIAAMGDSLTSANAAREGSVLGLGIQDRGVSFTGGGIGTWHEVITLPNIIKIFNPNLTGYAIGRGDFLSYNAQLNVAIPASLDEDLFVQVKLFMKKILQDRRINFANDWKLLSIMIGDNNICSKQCYDRRKHSPEAHKLHLQRALDFLYKNVPRLFVNVVSILDPTIAERIPCSRVSDALKRVACSCLYKFSTIKEGIIQLTSEVRKYQEAEKELVSSGRYNEREDFTVEWQPFTRILNAPEKVGEREHKRLKEFLNSELPIWSPECFHFNQRGLAEASIQLWNNMLEPVGNKTMTMDDVLINEFKCPTEKNPYLFTKVNTENLNLIGHQ